MHESTLTKALPVLERPGNWKIVTTRKSFPSAERSAAEPRWLQYVRVREIWYVTPHVMTKETTSNQLETTCAVINNRENTWLVT